MINDKTVFILGAGSNHVYGFPTGSELREYIITEFLSDLENIWDIYKNPPHPKDHQYFIFNTHPQINDKRKNEYLKIAPEFINKFKDSSNPSIDLFLSRNTRFEDIGKTAIIIKILRDERGSKFDEDLDATSRIIDWYKHIFIKMSETLIETDSFTDFKKNNLTFITFNYDRSIEYFIHKSLYNSFDEIIDHKMEIYTDNEYSPENLMPFKFLHVYGKISELYWQSGGELDYSPNGEIKIDKYSQNIKIIYEERKNEQEIKTIKDEISSAKKIYFLGFGFAPENLKILEIPHVLKPGQKIYGTALNWKKREIEELEKIFIKNEDFYKALHETKSELIIKNTNCLDLLRDYPPT